MELTVVSVDLPEADGYAIQIMDAFRAGGIISQSTIPMQSAPIPMRALTPDVKGVFIQVKDPKRPSQLAERTRKVLTDAGVKVGYYTNPTLVDPGFALTIGLP